MVFQIATGRFRTLGLQESVFWESISCRGSLEILVGLGIAILATRSQTDPEAAVKPCSNSEATVEALKFDDWCLECWSRSLTCSTDLGN